MSIYLLLCTLFLVIFQGGFYPQTYIIIGIISALLLLFKKKYFISPVHKALVILTLLYIISAYVNGMSYSMLTKAMLPLTLLIIALLYSTLDIKQKDKLIFFLTLFGLISSIIGIAMYIGLFRNENTVSSNSLVYTFQYANSAGCFYAVSFLLTVFNEKKWIRYSSPLCFMALICTKSIGAFVILSVLLMIHLFRLSVFDKIKKYVLSAVLIVFIIACIIIYYKGANSFIERIIHSYDGLRILKDNIVTGIGPGNWKYLFPFFQSAYYSAGIIHNSYVQTGVDSGFAAMLVVITLLCLSIYRYIKNKSSYNLAIVFVMVHSVMEYNLFFAGIDVLLIILALYEQDKAVTKPRFTVFIKISSFVAMLLLLLSLNGVFQIRNLEKYSYQNDTKNIQRVFDSNKLFMQNGYKENEIIGIYALKCGNSHNISKKSARYRRYEMIYCKDIDINTIISYIDEQKFFKNVRIEADKLVDKMTLSEEEKKQYEDYINSIDDSVDGWIKRLNKE